jgi:ATP-dependent RNA circularization protein (DNA/RNA ligase family)
MAEPEEKAFLSGDIAIEEKVDGANLGISVGFEGDIRVQNRGQYLDRPYVGQFAGLNRWLISREDMLFDILAEGLILFGEWCEARHSLEYDHLPDWFLAFDVYEKDTGSFWSIRRRNALAKELRLSVVPFIASGRYSVASLSARVFSEGSSLREGHLEGLYLRRDEIDILAARAKIVRPEFARSIGEHWSRRKIVRNRVSIRDTAEPPIHQID